MSDQENQRARAHVGFLDRAIKLARDAGLLAADVASHATGAITEALSPTNKEQTTQDNRRPINTAPTDGTTIRVYDIDGGIYLARWNALRGEWTPAMPIQLWSPVEGSK